MYIDRIEIEKFRSFRKAQMTFVHPDQDFSELDLPTPRLKNINLLLGDNGLGKTSLLKAIALACLGPSVEDAGIYAYRLVRREPRARTAASGIATVRASIVVHKEDRVSEGLVSLDSQVQVIRKGELERLRWSLPGDRHWKEIYSSKTTSFFVVGYGATRRVEEKERFDSGQRRRSSFARAQRVMSLFDDSYSLVPFTAWLPVVKSGKPSQYKQISSLLQKLTAKGHFRFTGLRDPGGEYLFERNGLKVPFPALSDGYRAYLGWISDFLYHMVFTSRLKGTNFSDLRGVVLIDEIDLHLHPKWQMQVLPTLARSLPGIQFIVTSHSPLVVGSLEWMNIVTMKTDRSEATTLERVVEPVHGLDADQVLLTDLFDLESTRAGGAQKQLKELALQAATGDTAAAVELVKRMGRGSEAAN